MTMTDVWVQQMEQSYDLVAIKELLRMAVLLLAVSVGMQAFWLYREIRK